MGLDFRLGTSCCMSTCACRQGKERKGWLCGIEGQARISTCVMTVDGEPRKSSINGK